MLHQIKKHPWFSLFSLISFIILISLGTWQVQRLIWKSEIISKVTENLARPAMPNLPDESNLANAEYKRVKLSGTFLHEHEIHLAAKYHNREFGYHIVTPFKSNEERIILVNRGWIPVDKKLPETRPETIIKNKTSISGILIKPYRKGWFTPENNAEKNLWFWLDMEKIADLTKLKFYPIIIQETTNQNNDALRKLHEEFKFRNDHLEYAITWYALAIGLAIIFVIYVRK